MPFMQSRGAVGRTLEFLKKGQITLNKNVRILMIAFNEDRFTAGKPPPHHEGLRNFVFWHLPQLQYKNPNVQMLTITNLTPNPWIKVFFENGSRMVVDCDSRTREEIHDHLKRVIGKTESELRAEAMTASMLVQNTANFGSAFPRHCICEVPGQIPCPAWDPLPQEMTGKGRKKLKEAADEAAAAAASAAASQPNASAAPTSSRT